MSYVNFKKLAAGSQLQIGDIPGVGYAVDPRDGKRKALKPERFMSDLQGQEFEDVTASSRVNFKKLAEETPTQPPLPQYTPRNESYKTPDMARVLEAIDLQLQILPDMVDDLLANPPRITKDEFVKDAMYWITKGVKDAFGG